MVGVPHAIASIMTSPNGSGQSIGNTSASAPPKNRLFLVVANLADEVHERIGEEVRDIAIEIDAVDRIDLGRDANRYARAFGDRDGTVGPFLGADSTDEREIAAIARAELVDICGQAVVHRSHPIRLRYGLALRIGNRHQRHRAKDAENFFHGERIQAAVKRRDRLCGESLENGEMHVIGMKMHDIEIVNTFGDLMHHNRMIGKAVDVGPRQTNGTSARREQVCFRPRIAARKEGHVVARGH
jgi:hypothetical protein